MQLGCPTLIYQNATLFWISTATIQKRCHSPSLVWHIWETQKTSYYQGVFFSLMWQMVQSCLIIEGIQKHK